MFIFLNWIFTITGSYKSDLSTSEISTFKDRGGDNTFHIIDHEGFTYRPFQDIEEYAWFLTPSLNLINLSASQIPQEQATIEHRLNLEHCIRF